MPAKNDLSAFKARAQAAPILWSLPPEPKPGRKTRAPGEKESETLALKLTKNEMQALERNAGLIPKGAYVKDILRTKTMAFK